MKHASEIQRRKRVVLIDWGDTLMKDFTEYEGPMVSWPRIESVEHADEVLRTLRIDYLLALVTNAADSDEEDIRAALDKVGLGSLLDRIYCYQGVGHKKPSSDFFKCILDDLGLEPTQAVMVGDDFEKDILGANRCGIKAVWFNPQSSDIQTGDMYRTINDLRSLPGVILDFF